MDKLAEVMAELEKKGSEQTRKIFAKHGAPASAFGVKVGDLKTIAKKIKGRQDLALKLYDTGNPDAMYLAGIVADGLQMSKRQLEQWAKEATWHMISEYTVPGVAVENLSAVHLATKWIRSKKETLSSTGWCTYSGVLAKRGDDELDLAEVGGLLSKIETELDHSANRVRYTMNGFVIAVGSYVQPLLKSAKRTAKKIGVVVCDVGETACKVPLATDYIAKVEKMGRVGRKRKTVKC
ncbi:DNA alkylation repair protein [bacterium]|nr:DNA alkylation repair protein [bacterium]